MFNFRFHELRNYNSGYFQTVVNYCREVFHCSKEEIDSLAGKMLASEGEKVRAHLIYAECFGELCGFVIFYYFPINKVGFVEAMVVTEGHRNQGIGTQLYLHMTDFLKDHYTDCAGHVLEMCTEKKDYDKRKAFFLKQGCIPIDLNFFISDPVVCGSGIKILYHPYKLNQAYSLSTMESILREISTALTH